jgi:hypothetical protein
LGVQVQRAGWIDTAYPQGFFVDDLAPVDDKHYAVKLAPRMGFGKETVVPVRTGILLCLTVGKEQNIQDR